MQALPQPRRARRSPVGGAGLIWAANVERYYGERRFHPGALPNVVDPEYLPRQEKSRGSLGVVTLLGPKVRELISLAVAVTLRCDGCITVHTEAALRHGATEEEIAEALGVAVAINAGAALVYSTRVLDAVRNHPSAPPA
jgi:AhpD family alkylhydroperoxidase